MKYGMIVFKKTENLGDDIQSYASLRYYPKIDYYIEREEMNLFRSNNKEMVATILNGWFIHNAHAFPPSPFIYSLVTSIHMTNYLNDEEPIYFDQTTIDFFKKNQPIGCRDQLVSKYLNNKNIKNYFSGCLTLTIKPFSNIKQENKIILVDVGETVENHVTKISNIKVEKYTHNLNIEKNIKLSYEKRMENVELRLKKYQSAKMVITSRLHCALPCIALGIPVLLIYKNDIDVHNRLGVYLEFLSYCNEEKLLKTKNNKDLFTLIQEKKDFSHLANKLEKECIEFINKSKTTPKDCNCDFEEYLLKNSIRTNNFIDIYKKQSLENIYKREEILQKTFSKEYENLYLKYKVAHAEKEYCINNIEKFSYDIKRLQHLRSSKFYKLYSVLKKVYRKLLFWRKK